MQETIYMSSLVGGTQVDINTEHIKQHGGIIASRGTANKADLLTDLKLITGKTPDEFKEAEQFYLKIKNQFPNKKIILTGHSLGGYYAEMLHLKYGEKCITFDSPGSRKFRKINKPELKECNLEDSLVLYKSPSNIINSTLPQVSQHCHRFQIIFLNWI